MNLHDTRGCKGELAFLVGMERQALVALLCGAMNFIERLQMNGVCAMQIGVSSLKYIGTMV